VNENEARRRRIAECVRAQEAQQGFPEITLERVREVLDMELVGGGWYTRACRYLLGELDETIEALANLHAEVEGAESVGICLPERVASLNASQRLSALGYTGDAGGA
jgi:hypothetical protein